MNFLLGKLLGMPVRFFSAGKLLIANYHRVLAEPDAVYPATDQVLFERHVRTIKACFNPIRLDKAIEQLQAGTLPRNSVSITFDDGYADNCTVALPVLKKWGVPASFFIATGFLNGGRMWNDTVIESIRCVSKPTIDLNEMKLGILNTANDYEKNKSVTHIISKLKHLPFDERAQAIEQLQAIIGQSLPDNLMMTSEQVKTLHNEGMEIGGHTVSHPILTRVADDIALQEMQQSREFLQSLINEPVTGFAYPNGYPNRDYAKVHTELAKKAGYKYAVTTAVGVVGKGADYFQLPRGGLWDKSALRTAVRVSSHLIRAGNGVRASE